MEPLEQVKTHYIKELLAKGKREDGRGMFDFRSIKITRGLLGNSEGSAQVDLGGTKVLAGVKLQVEEPMEDTPKQGTIAVAAELLPLAHAEFESGPPSPEAIELGRVVDRGIRAAECIDLEGLFIEEGKAWTVFIDLYILNHDGNLFDASSLAAMAAIMDAKVPKFNSEKKEADYKERTTPLKLKNTVVSTTFGKIGDALVLDMDMNEENSVDTRLTIETDGKVVRAMQKGLGGSFSREEIERLVDVAFDKYSTVKSILEQ